MGFILIASSLPTTPVTGTGGAIASLGTAVISPGIQINLTSVGPGVAGTTTEVTPILVTNPPVPVNNTVTVSIGTQEPVVAVVADSQVFTSAINPASPRPGEFIQNPYTGEVILYTAIALTTVAAQTLSTSQVLYRQRIPGPHPDWFSRVPITGQFQIGLAFEQQPTGGFQFQVLGRANLLALLSAFRPDTRIPFYGYGLRVINIQFEQDQLSEQPIGFYTISASLAGANEWELIEPISIADLTKTEGTGIPTTTQPRSTITVTELGAKAGITISMPVTSINIAKRKSSETLTVDTEFKARLRHQGLFADYCEDTLKAINIDSVNFWTYSDETILEPPTIQYLGRQTKQQLGSVTISSSTKSPAPLPNTFDLIGNFTIQNEDPDLIGKANVFPGTEITGRFTGVYPSEEQEDRLGQSFLDARPSWKRKPIIRITLEKGDVNPTSPPDNTTIIKTTSLNYTNSGPTKVIESTTTENGSPVRATTKVYGFVYLAKDTNVVQNYQDAAQLRITNPGAYWQLVKETTTTWVYDNNYNYEVGTITTGRELFAFQNESDSLETYTLTRQIAELKNTNFSAAAAVSNVPTSTIINETNEQIARKIKTAMSYNIQWKTIYEVMGRRLKAMSSVYDDRSNLSGKYIYFNYAGPDGSNQVGQVADPNFAPPYFAEQEWNYHNSFDSMPNPEKPQTVIENGVSKKIQKPPLTTGRETMNRRDIKTYPAPGNAADGTLAFRSITVTTSNTEMQAEYFQNAGQRQGEPSSIPDRYTEFVSEFSAEGANYDNAVTRTTFEERVGRPGVAGRKPDEYEQTPPEGDKVTQTFDNRQHIVTSPGYDIEVREQQSYPYAITLDDAKRAVRTDAIVAEINNPSRTVDITIPINLQIKPGDKVMATLSGIIYRCRVSRIDHQGEILGVVDGALQIEGITRLQLSPDREPDYTWTTRPNPAGTSQTFVETPAGTSIIYDARLDPGILSRRNF